MEPMTWGILLLAAGALGGFMVGGQFAEGKRIDHAVRMRHAKKACEGYRLLIEGYARSLIVTEEDEHVRFLAVCVLRDHAKHIVSITATEASALDTKTDELGSLVQVVTESLGIKTEEIK